MARMMSRAAPYGDASETEKRNERRERCWARVRDLFLLDTKEVEFICIRETRKFEHWTALHRILKESLHGTSTHEHEHKIFFSSLLFFRRTQSLSVEHTSGFKLGWPPREILWSISFVHEAPGAGSACCTIVE